MCCKVLETWSCANLWKMSRFTFVFKYRNKRIAVQAQGRLSIAEQHFFFLSDVSVRPSRKSFIFIIISQYFHNASLPEIVNLNLKTKALLRRRRDISR